MAIDLNELKRLASLATPGPWKWWTSNSVKRITGPNGQDGGVLSAYVHSGYADLRVSEEDQKFIEAANPSAILELIGQVEELRQQVGKLEAADARRYRWLRDIGDATWRPFGIREGYSAAIADAAIDAAMQSAGKQGGGE